MTARSALVIAAALSLTGCAKKVISPMDRAEAANMASEADFAMNVHEWARAEGLYTKATALSPDLGDTWIALGVARMHLNDHSGAKSAYKSAVEAYKSAFKSDPGNAQALEQQAYVLVLLGRPDDARSVAANARKDHPDDRTLRAFIDDGELEKVIADPALKDISP
jgi:tetratricopeptide (TPR) repeat protein